MKKLLSITLAMFLFISYGGVGNAAEIFNNEDTSSLTNNLSKEYILDEDNLNNDEPVIQPYALPAILAPAASILVSYIAKHGLKKAIGNWSKSIVSTMIRSIPAVTKAAAKDLGYTEVEGQYSHGAKIFKAGKKAKGPKYISVDKDGHNGGTWKGASSIKNLGSKKTRSGTYDEELNRIGD
uniref:toxin C-terminal domain-containing protein n=1 Tax=Solibacillus sp. FSL R5-0449 TaxID=2921639 RepID=UPI00403F098E